MEGCSLSSEEFLYPATFAGFSDISLALEPVFQVWGKNCRDFIKGTILRECEWYAWDTRAFEDGSDLVHKSTKASQYLLMKLDLS
jgi:hypothetical protein